MNVTTRNEKRQPFAALWRTINTRTFWSDAIIFLCGLLFLYSAGDKLLAYESFRVQMGKSPIISGYEDFLVWFIPSLELLIVLLMVPLATRQLGLYAFFTLMLLFTGYITLLLLSDTIIPCGCNALTEKLSLETHIVMNSLFGAMAVTGILISPPSHLRLRGLYVRYKRLFTQDRPSIRASFFSLFKRKEVKGKKD